jgi:hypothetical protein
MKRLFLLLAAFAILTSGTNAHAQLNNLFANPGTQSPASPNDASADVAQLLKSSGLKFEMESEGTYLVTSEAEGVSLPVYVYQNKAGSILWVKVNLDELKGNPADHADKLLSLMELSGTFSGAFYSYNSQTRFLEIYNAIPVNEVTVAGLKSRIESMTLQVIRQRDAWYASEWTNPRHVGSWSASLSGNVTMTIDLRADGSFQLTNQADSQVTSIHGNYQIQSGQLQMRDNDGNQITGEIVFVDGNHFDLSVNSQKLSFERG